MSYRRNIHFSQLDALRGVAALMVVFNHFALVGPLRWIWRTPLRFLATGHESVILFFILSGFVLSLQLASSKKINFKDYLIKRICRIYLPYLAILMGTLLIMDIVLGGEVKWAGPWVAELWQERLSWPEIADHLVFLGAYRADHAIPVIWSLVYEMRISIIFPLIIIVMTRVRVRTCLFMALGISAISLIAVKETGADPTNANFDLSWFMTAHYASMFVVGASLATHRQQWTFWLEKGRRTEIALGLSLIFYFISRSSILVFPPAVGQFVFDWGVAIGASGLICTSLVSSRMTSVLSNPLFMFMGRISYSLYLTHAVVLLTVIHLFPMAQHQMLTLGLAAVLVIPVAAMSFYLFEKPSIAFGRLITARKRLMTDTPSVT